MTRSLLLMIINATLIPTTTKPPATKLEIKFANELVIFDSVIILSSSTFGLMSKVKIQSILFYYSIKFLINK